MSKKIPPNPSTYDSADTIPVEFFILNEDNPRFIKDKQGRDLLRSLKSFPEMMTLRPITIKSWDNPLVLAGNQRLGGIIALGYKVIPRAWVQTAEGFSEEQIKRFVIQDNITAGGWNFEMLANHYEEEELHDWGLDVIFDDSEPAKPGEGAEAGIQTRQAHIGDLFTISIGDAQDGTTPVGFTLFAPQPLKGTNPTDEAGNIFNPFLKEIDKAIIRFSKHAKKAGITYTVVKNDTDITDLYNKL